MKLIKYFLIGALSILNSLSFGVFGKNEKMVSEEHTISRKWSKTTNTGWMDFDFNESKFIRPNKIIKSVEWKVGINAEYYNWQYSDWQSSTNSDNEWFRERSTNGESEYPFKLQVWRDWWSCGNSALNLEIKINNKWQRLLKFQKTFGYCWKLDYSYGFEIKFKFNYEDQYKQQLDNFKEAVSSKRYKISTPTIDLDEKWRVEKHFTTLKDEIKNDLITNIIDPIFKKYNQKYKKNTIFKNVWDFKKNINIKKNGEKKVIATFKPEYKYGQTTYTEKITVNYDLNVNPNADYYQKQLNGLFERINNKFNIKVASFSEGEKWIKNSKSTDIHKEIENHFHEEITEQIIKLKEKKVDIFEFDRFNLKMNFERLNNNQIQLNVKPITYEWSNFNKKYEVLKDINIIYNLELDREYLKNDIDSRIKFFINNEEQGRKEIEINTNKRKQKILAFNEKVNLEFYPTMSENIRDSILEQISITSSTGEVIKIREFSEDGNSKYSKIYKATLEEPKMEADEDGNIKDEVIYYHIEIKRIIRNSEGMFEVLPNPVYKKSILIKETNPGIEFQYKTEISSSDSNNGIKEVIRVLPETVVYDKKLDEEIPELFSLETKNMLLKNKKVNSIFSNISSWLVSTKSTKPIIKEKEIPYIKNITEINNKNKRERYDFTKDGLKQWKNMGIAWSGLTNGFLEYQIETVFSNLTPKYTLNHFDNAIGCLLQQIPELEEKANKENDADKRNKIKQEIDKLNSQLYERMIKIKDGMRSTSFWDSNLAKLIIKYYKNSDRKYFLNFTLQETKNLINEFIEWIKTIVFPHEKDPLEEKVLEEMNAKEKANYLARKIIETFKNKNLTFSSKLNDEIIFNDIFNSEIKKRIISWMSESEKALAILRDPKTSLKFKVFNSDKSELNQIKIGRISITKILEFKVKYDTETSIFIPSINLIFRVGKPEDDINPDYEDPDKVIDEKNKIIDDPDDKTGDKEPEIPDKIGNGKMSKRNLGIIIGSILGAGSIIVSVTVIFYIRKIKKIN